MRTRRPFADHEDAVIRERVEELGCAGVGRLLGRPAGSVVSRSIHLGLRGRTRPTQRRFGATEDRVIRDAAGRLTVSEVASALGRRRGVVYERAERLGVVLLRRKGRPQYRYEHPDGYVRVRGTGVLYAQEHRAIMAGAMGRALTADEVVHHINLDRSDNRPENLAVLPDGAAHGQAHRSLVIVAGELVRRGVISFDRDTSTYEVR